MKGWSEDFKAQADVYFIVEGQTLRVHSFMLGQSKVFYPAVKELQGSGALRIKDAFKGISVREMDLLLQEVYLCPTAGSLNTVDKCVKMLALTLRFGFGSVYHKALSALEAMEKELWGWLRQQEPMELEAWVYLAMGPDAGFMRRVLVKFFEYHYETYIYGSHPKWATVRAILGVDGIDAIHAYLVNSWKNEGGRFLTCATPWSDTRTEPFAGWRLQT